MSLIFFDTNILSYLVEEQLEETFFIFLKEQKLSACMTTSFLLEMSKTNACDKRKKFLQFIQNDMFKKLRSDNDLECEEIINEVSRVFPKLYREKSNLITNVYKNREYFSKQLWQECVSQHEYLHRIAMQMLENEGMQTINVQKRNKKSFSKWNIDKIQLNEITASIPSIYIPAAVNINTNKKYELWRIDSLLTLLNFYQNQSCNQRLVSDWLDPYLDMKGFIDNKQNYYDFWLNKAELNNMKMQWIRWAIKFVQQFKKIKSSNPFDELHVSYLVGVQYFVTADKPLYDCLKRIKQDKIIDFAEPILIQVKDSDIMCQLKDKLNFPL